MMSDLRPVLLLLVVCACPLLLTARTTVHGAQAPAVAPAQPDPDPLLAPAQQLIADHRYQDAEELLRKLLIHEHSDAEAQYLLAYSLFRQNKPSDSLREYTRAAQLRVPTAKDLRWVAEDYVLLNDYADAKVWMTRSVATDEGDEQSWYALGRINYSQTAYAEAERCFRHALQLQPQDERAENNLGLTLEALYRADEAVQAYRRAIALQDGQRQDEQPYINLGIVLMHRNELAEAEHLLERAVSIAPDDPMALMNLAQVQVAQQNYLQAEVHLRHALLQRPNDAALHFQLARVLHKIGRGEEAKAEYTRASQLNGSRSTPEP